MLLGGTITELQHRMSMNEFRTWLKYRQKYGPMNDVRRFDRPAAMLGNLICRAVGSKDSKMTDFMPFGVEEKEPEFSDIVAAFKGVNIAKPR